MCGHLICGKSTIEHQGVTGMDEFGRSSANEFLLFGVELPTFRNGKADSNPQVWLGSAPGPGNKATLTDLGQIAAHRRIRESKFGSYLLHGSAVVLLYKLDYLLPPVRNHRALHGITFPRTA